ncbi:MAG: hypothetical protein FJY67_05935 [Calditrichaeota bacterium]|nr:hypothetical protein [Calditrichota bacterium]
MSTIETALPPVTSHTSAGLEQVPIPARLYRSIAVVGGLLLSGSFLLTPDRTWMDLLMAGLALTTLGLGGIFFVALQYVTGAHWSVVIRRTAEALYSCLPIGAILLGIVLILRPSLYAWTNPESHFEGFKGLWLSRGFFILRAAIYIAIWISLGRKIIGLSRQQDTTRDPGLTRLAAKWSGLFIVAFALTFWLASVDWLMSLEPHWFSTIFGVYNFAGMFTATLAVISLLVVRLMTRGGLKGLATAEHLHDLGKLLFAFSVFWMYIWFSQYMLIWYANIPEEAVYYTRRMAGAWGSLMLLNVFLNWGLPFLALMSATTKRSGPILTKVATAVLAGRALDIYLMAAPSAGLEPRIGLAEVGALLLTVGLAVVAIKRELSRFPLFPTGDPGLTASLHHHQ